MPERKEFLPIILLRHRPHSIMSFAPIKKHRRSRAADEKAADEKAADEKATEEKPQ